MLNVPYFHWLQCQGQVGLQQAYIRQLLLGYVEVGPCDRQDELKSVTVKTADNSNASTDDDDSCATPFDSM